VVSLAHAALSPCTNLHSCTLRQSKPCFMCNICSPFLHLWASMAVTSPCMATAAGCHVTETLLIVAGGGGGGGGGDGGGWGDAGAPQPDGGSPLQEDGAGNDGEEDGSSRAAVVQSEDEEPPVYRSRGSSRSHYR
jgi:hypothetical protein